VSLLLPNGLEWLASCLAIWKLGAVPNPLSSRLPGRERDAILARADPALIVGVDAADAGGRASVPSGFEPDASLSDAPLPDRTPRTSARSHRAAAPELPS